MLHTSIFYEACCLSFCDILDILKRSFSWYGVAYHIWWGLCGSPAKISGDCSWRRSSAPMTPMTHFKAFLKLITQNPIRFPTFRSTAPESAPNHISPRAMVLPKSKNAVGLGNALMNDRLGKGKGSDRKKISQADGVARTGPNGETYVTNKPKEAAWVKMRSVTEQAALEEVW